MTLAVALGEALEVGHARHRPVGAHDLAEIRRLEHDERDDRGALGADLRRTLAAGRQLQHLWHQEEEPEQHEHQRDRAHQVHVTRGDRRQGFDGGQPAEREQRAESVPRGHHPQPRRDGVQHDEIRGAEGPDRAGEERVVQHAAQPPEALGQQAHQDRQRQDAQRHHCNRTPRDRKPAHRSVLPIGHENRVLV